MTMTEEERIAHANEVICFCPRCFASSDGGSWGPEASVDHCANCGAGGKMPTLPRWAIQSIREQASWVGKRYYPSQEDKDMAAEIEALRALVPVMPGRSAEKNEDGSWAVIQKTPNSSIMMYTEATSAEEAMRKLHTALPYVKAMEPARPVTKYRWSKPYYGVQHLIRECGERWATITAVGESFHLTCWTVRREGGVSFESPNYFFDKHAHAIAAGERYADNGELPSSNCRVR
jgi:hypothetical protein